MVRTWMNLASVLVPYRTWYLFFFFLLETRGNEGGKRRTSKSSFLLPASVRREDFQVRVFRRGGLGAWAGIFLPESRTRQPFTIARFLATNCMRMRRVSHTFSVFRIRIFYPYPVVLTVTAVCTDRLGKSSSIQYKQ